MARVTLFLLACAVIATAVDPKGSAAVGITMQSAVICTLAWGAFSMLVIVLLQPVLKRLWASLVAGALIGGFYGASFNFYDHGSIWDRADVFIVITFIGTGMIIAFRTRRMYARRAAQNTGKV